MADRRSQIDAFFDREEEAQTPTVDPMADLRSPDEVASERRVAEEVGQPQAAVRAYPELFAQSAEARRTQRATHASPRLRAWLENPDNLAVARDDIENLSRVESLQRRQVGLFNAADPVGFVGLINRYRRGEAVVELGRLQNIEVTRQLHSGRVSTSLRNPQRIAQLREQLAQPEPDAPPVLGIMAEQLPYMFGATAGSARAYGEYLQWAERNLDRSNAGDVVGGGIESIIEGTRGGADFTAAVEAGNAFDEISQFRTEDGDPIDPEIAARAAHDYGQFSAGVEVVGFGGVIEAARASGVLKTLGKRGLRQLLLRNALARMGVSVASGYAVEGAEEATQEIGQIAFGQRAQAEDGGDFAPLNLSDAGQRVVQSFLIGGVPGAAMAGAPHVPGVVNDLARISRSQDAQAKIEEWSQAAQESRLGERLPSARRDAVNAMTEGTPLETVRIDADAFIEHFQGANQNPLVEAGKLGITPEALQAAMASHGELAISAGDFDTQILRVPANAALAKHARFSPSDFTQAEREALGPEIEKSAKEIIEEAAATMEADNEIGAAVETRMRELLARAAEEGGPRAEVGARYARLIAALPRALVARARATNPAYAEKLDASLRTLFSENVDVQGPARASGGGGIVEMPQRGTGPDAGPVRSDRYTPPEGVRMSERMRKIVEMAVNGASNDWIAEEMGVASNNVRVTLNQAKARLGGATPWESAGVGGAEKGVNPRTGEPTFTSEHLARVRQQMRDAGTPERDINSAIAERLNMERANVTKRLWAYDQEQKKAEREAVREPEPETAMDARRAWVDAHVVRRPVPGGEPGDYQHGFVLSSGRYMELGIGDDGNGAASIEWTFLNRMERADPDDSTTLYKDGDEHITVSEWREIRIAIQAIVEADMAQHERPAYVFTPQRESNRRANMAMIAELNGLGYRLEEDQGAVYLFHPYASIANNGRIKPQDGWAPNFEESQAYGSQEEASDAQQAFYDATRELSPDTGNPKGIADATRRERQAAEKSRAEAEADVARSGTGDRELKQGDTDPQEGDRRRSVGGFIPIPDANDQMAAAIIRLYSHENGSSYNLSTFLHETGHLFLEIFRGIAADPEAPQEFQQMWRDTLAWFGVTPEEWAKLDYESRVPYHEQWAETFERYLMEGQAPSLSLREAFATFKQWLLNVYRSIARFAANRPNARFSPEIREVFDRLIATDNEIAEARAAMGADFALSREAFKTEEEFAQYQQAIAEARDAQEADLRARAFDAYARKSKRWWRGERERMRDAATRAVDSEPARRAEQWLAFQEWRALPDTTLSDEGEVSYVAPANALEDMPEGLPAMQLSPEAIQQDWPNASLPTSIQPRTDVETVLAEAMRLKAQEKGRGQFRAQRLSSFIKKQGGIRDPDGRIKTALGSGRRRPGLINNETGKTPEEMMRLATEAGYFGEGAAREMRQGDGLDAGSARGEFVPPDADGIAYYRNGGFEIQYVEDGDITSVQDVHTAPDARGQGLARRGMEEFLARQDERNQITRLEPAAQDEITNQERLEDFYGSLGFKPVEEDVVWERMPRRTRRSRPSPDGGSAGGGRVVYRGLNRPYDPANGGYYQSFTSSLEDAREYGPNVMAAHINPGRNLAVDGGGNNFNAISVEQLPADVRARLHPSVGQAATTDQIAHAAREAGYDSVTVRNVHDNRWGERPARGAEPRTIDFVFDTRNISPLDSVPEQPTTAAQAAERVKLSDADRALLDELEADLRAPERPNASDGFEMFQGDRVQPRPLIAVHNTTAKKLLHAVRMGGMAVPSLAVIRADIGFDNFGDITLIAPPSLIDPRGGGSARVFDADVYSPRYPQVSFKVNERKFSALIERPVFQEASRDLGFKMSTELDESTTRQNGMDAVLESTVIQLAYARMNGINVDIPIVEGYREGETRPDYWTVRQDLRERVGNDPAFMQWAEAEFGAAFEGERIFQGWTNAGNARYLPHNLNTVVRVLKRELRDGEGFNYGVGSIRSKVAREFRSLTAIKNARDQIVDSATMEALKNEANDEFVALANQFVEKSGRTSVRDQMGFLDVFSEHLKEVAETHRVSVMDQYYPSPLSDEEKASVVAFLEKLRALPTEYFEAKIRRAVGLNEFVAAVVPEGTDARTMEALSAAGITDIRTYPKGDVSARQRAVMQVRPTEMFAGANDKAPNLEEFLSTLIADLTGERQVYSARDTNALASAQALSDAQEWFDAHDIDLSKDKETIRAQIVAAIEKDRGSENQWAPDDIAPWFGMSSGDELVQALAGLKPRNVAIEEQIDAMLEAEHGDAGSRSKIEETARLAAHAEVQARRIEIELAAIQKATGGRATPVGRAAKAYAERQIQAMTVKQIRNYETFLAGERRAARAAMEATQKKDYATAAQMKQRQLVSFHLYRFARDASEEMDRAQRYFQKFDRDTVRAKIHPPLMDQIDQALEGIDLRAKPRISERKRQNFNAWLADMQAEGLEHLVVADPDFIEAARNRPFASLTLEDARGIRDAVRNFEHIGRRWREVLGARDARLLDEAVAEMSASMATVKPLSFVNPADHSPGLIERLDTGRQSFHAQLSRVEFVARAMDGMKQNGPVWNGLFRPLTEARDREETRQQQAQRDIEQLFSVYDAKERADMWTKRKFYPQVPNRNGTAMGRNFTKQEILAIALNTGNEYNFGALIAGDNWNEQQVRALLDSAMDARDWQFVQSAWDYVEGFWPEIEALYLKSAGVAPPKVAPTPFTNRHGEWRGGYWHLEYDYGRDQRVREEAEHGAVQEAFGGFRLRTQTPNGFSKARQGSGGRPVRLELSVLSEHVNEVIHDLEFRMPVLNTWRLVKHSGFREAFVRAAGQEQYDQLKPWLQYVATERMPPERGFAGVIKLLRRNTPIALMGYAISTVAQQPAGLMGTFARVGTGRVMGKAAELLSQPWTWADHARFINTRSTLMRNRTMISQREIREMVQEINSRGHVDAVNLMLTGSLSQKKAAFERVAQLMQRYALFPLAFVDKWVSSAAWKAAYDKALAGHVEGVSPQNEADVIAYADHIIRTTFGSGRPEDLSPVMRSSEIGKLITPAFSYFNTQYNQLYNEQAPGMLRGKISPLEFATFITFTIVAQALISQWLAGRWGPDDDESEEDRNARLAMEVALAPIAGIPLLRDMARATLQTATTGATFGSNVPAFGAVSSTGMGVGGAVYDLKEDGEISRKSMRDLTMAAGYWFGLPSNALWRAGEAATDVATGEDDLSDPADTAAEAFLRDRR